MRALSACVVVVLAAGCAKMFPGRVATGVARLTARNAGTLASLLQSDKKCGFASPSVRANRTLTGTPGTKGTVTWTVTDCHLDLGELHAVSRDCDDVAMKAGGKAVVSATLTLSGMLTGNADEPVAPADSNAVSIDVDATFDEYVVREDGSNSALTIHSGGLKFNVVPRLAVSASQGVCSIPTQNVLLDGVTWSASTVTIDDEGSLIDVDVDGSNFSAQVGQGADKENALWGSLSVWGSSQTVPEAGDNGGLDPTYDGAAYQKSWACTADLAKPIDYSCPSFDDAIAVGGARLTVMLFGDLASVVNADTACGFASAGVTAKPTSTGTLGDRGGAVTVTIASPCELHFATPTVVGTDCNGVSLTVQGTVKVTGTKTVSGILSGDPKEPVVPVTRDMAKLQLAMDFTDFSLIDSTGKGIKVASGQLKGTVMPRAAKDSTTGVCSIITPVTTYEGIAWTNGQVTVVTPDLSIDLTMDSSMLDAQNGSKDGRTNALSGTLSANGKAVKLPSELDPAYDPAAFDMSYACTPNMVVPQSEDDCGMYDVLGAGAARLLVQTAGAAAVRIIDDSSCGFAGWLVKLNPAAVEGGDGEQGSMTWHVDACDVGASSKTDYDTDCLGGKDSIQGVLKASATQKVTGLRKVIVGVVNSITPNAPDAVTITFDRAELTNLSATHTAPGASAPEATLTLRQGVMTGTVKPVTAERKSAPGTYDVPTPVATFSSLSVTGAVATLKAGAKTFNLNIDSAMLQAMNGHFRGQGNSLSGSISIDHHTVTLNPMGLDPGFSQSTFDASYACTSDMTSVLPP